MDEEEKREQLLNFLDRNAFDPILSVEPEQFRGHDRETYDDVRKSTESEKRRFHESYRTARDVRDNYMSDLKSRTAWKINSELEDLGLPRLPQFRDEFMDLCQKLDV